MNFDFFFDQQISISKTFKKNFKCECRFWQVKVLYSIVITIPTEHFKCF